MRGRGDPPTFNELRVGSPPVLDKFILGHFDLLCWGLFGGGAIIFFAGLGFADLFGTETLHHTSNAVAVGLFILGALFLVFFEDKSENSTIFTNMDS
jgi:hypothetical protein